MRLAILRAILALLVAMLGVGLTVTLARPALIGGAVGVRVGFPGMAVELARAVLPIVVSLLLAAFSIRFGFRALRAKVALTDDLARGGKLLFVTAWAAWIWLVVELLYRQVWLGGATLFGNISSSLLWSAAAVALCFAADRMLPWSRAPRGVRNLGLGVVVAVGLVAALSGWSHRHVVPRLALLPIAIVGLGLLASGVHRVESGPRGRMLVELGLASTLLSGPIWSFLT
jgi:hypothetical protein